MLFRSIASNPHLVVLNKRDLASAERIESLLGEFAGQRVVVLSVQQQQGLDALQDAMYQMIVGDQGELCEQMTCAPNARHRSILHNTLTACSNFEQAMQEGAPVDLLAVEVQTALDHLGDITGLTTPDEVLDAVFSQFCIGK